MTEVMELGRLIVQGPFVYQKIKDVVITEKRNEHGRMRLRLVLGEEQSEQELSRLEQAPVSLLTMDGTKVFCGICSDFGLERYAGYGELTVTAVTASYLADMTPNSRTFQSESKTLKDVAEQVLSPYQPLLSFERNPVISQMIYQQNETDWGFVKRIANQAGLSLFVNGKEPGFVVSVGTVPFSIQSREELPQELTEKNITALRSLQQTVNPQLRAFELEQRGGIIPDLGLGTGHCLQSGRMFVIVESKISASFGVVTNQIKYTGKEGALPQPQQAGVSAGGTSAGAENVPVSQGPAPSLHSSNVISGKVLEVAGSQVKVQFDSDKDGSGGTRWIPYASGLSDCVYVMPDVGDSVFCYFENDGTIVCLGSRHVDNTHPDFTNHKEKVLTSKKRMIKFKENGLDITANRDEIDGNGGMQLKITLSDEEGIEIAATKDVVFASQERIYIQAVEQEPEDPSVSQAIVDSQIALAQKFQTTEAAGTAYLSSHGGVIDSATMTEAGVDALLEIGGAILDDVISPFEWAVNTAKSWVTPDQGPVDNSVKFEAVDSKQVMVFGLKGCILEVGDSFFSITDEHIYTQGPQIHQLGFSRDRQYGRMEESTNTFMDNLLDGFQLALDIVGIVGSFCPPLNVVASVANAAISVCRGDYGRAATNLLGCIPGGSVLGFAEKALTAADKLHTVVKLLQFLAKVTKAISTAQLILGSKDALLGVGNFFQVVFSDASGQEKWDATYNMINGLKPYIGPAIKLKMALDSRRNEPKAPENPADTDTDTAKAGTTPKKDQTDCGDPIDMVTGSQRMSNTDFVVKDLSGEFRLVRTYESLYKNEGGILGERWFFNIEARIWIQGERVTALLPDMHLEHFRKTGDTYLNERSGRGSYRLSETETGFCLYLVAEKKQYQFDASGRLSMISDRNKNRIWFGYLGNTLQRIEFPGGQVLEFTYEQGKLAEIRDMLGRKICYRYDKELLSQVRLADEGLIRYAYTQEGYLSSVIDQNGQEYVRNEYDFSGRVTRQLLATGEEFIVLYDESRRKTSFQTLDKGDRLDFYYNKDGLVEKTVYPDGSTEEKRFDDYKNVIWEKDRNGGELTRSYDGEGRLLEETLPNGLVTWFAYDDQDNRIREWNNNGRELCYGYDGWGNCTERRMSLGEGRYSTERYRYDSHGRMTKRTDANGRRTCYRYEGLSALPETVILPNGDRIQYTYDRAGRCLSVSNEFGERRFGYNSLDYLCLSVTPLGHTTSWEYDRLGNLIRLLMPNQYEKASDDRMGTHFYYDAMDKLTASVDSMGNVLATPRDRYGNIRKEINPNAYDRRTKDGEGITYDYDEEDRRIRIRYPDGGVERIFYDPNGNLIKKVSAEAYDPQSDDGPGYCYEYDSVNRLVQITAPDGVVQKRYVYDLNGNIIKEIDGVGCLLGEEDALRPGILYCYNKAGWLLEKREPVKREKGHTAYRLTQYRYDSAGNRTEELRYQDFQQEEGASGSVHRIRYEYDENDRRIRVSDSTGASVEYGYNSMNLCVSERRLLSDGITQVFRYTYDGEGRCIRQEQSADPEGSKKSFSTTIYEYDKNGNLLRVVLPFGGEILREYDDVDRMITEVHRDPRGGIHNRTEYSYDKAGNLVEIRDRLGRTTRMEYDLRNQEIRRREKDQGVTLRSYDKDGRLSKLVRPNQYREETGDGEGYRYLYDLLGRVTEVLGPDNQVLRRNAYDEGGRLVHQSDPVESGVDFSYDLIGNRVGIRTTKGTTQELEYDARGNITGVADGNQNRTRYELDAWGRIRGIVKPDGTRESYTYDYAGNLTGSTDGEGNETRYEYNAAGKLSAVIDPAGGREEYRYDLGNRLCQKTDRNQVTTEYGYNLYGAPLYRRASDGGGEFFEYTPEGFLSSAISEGMRYSYEYDEMGRMIRKSASGRALLALAYDKNGNEVRRTDVTGKTVEYRYNDLDFLTEIWDDGTRLAEYGYYPDGRIREVQHGPIRQSYGYDTDKNLISLRVEAGGTLLSDSLYAYDGNGNRIGKSMSGKETRYLYDSLDQLVKVEYPTGSEELFYDRAGNRTKRVLSGGEELYSYDSRNRLMSLSTKDGEISFRYDPAGNLLEDGKARYEYDAFNRMVKAETFDGEVQGNRYDPEGLRHEMEENGKLVQFIFHKGEVIAEQEEGERVTRFIRGSELIARQTDYARTYYHYASDEMGSVAYLTDGDGKVENRYEYDAWGNVMEAEEGIPNRFQFTGEQLDPVTQQYYLRARFYNPVIARFTQEDTYRGDGLNLYAYCRNNPVTYVDPSGHATDCMKDAYKAALEAGMTPKEAYAAAKEAYAQNHMDGSKPTVNVGDDRSMTREQWKAADRALRMGYTQDANGKWHRPDGSFASNAEVGRIGADNNHYLNRPYIRKEIIDELGGRGPHVVVGVDGTPYVCQNPDLGHTPGNEFWRHRAQAEAEGLSQAEFNDRMNNPDFYRWEDPSRNRSHVDEDHSSLN